ncbi:MAG: hypothetical protein ABEK59_05180 [Halobacteria archaeon]
MVNSSELLEMDKAELDELFAEGETPTLEEIEGDTDGTVLAGRGGLRTEIGREIANLPTLPWQGKSIEGGEGTNRFGYGPLSQQGFEFDTRITESLRGWGSVLVFDYDVPENPPGIRRIRDDLKKVDEGVFLGTSNIEVAGNHRFLLYFVLEQKEKKIEV